jgi:hypothetical protein
MKTAFAFALILLLCTAYRSQICQIPNLRGLSLGMTAAQIEQRLVIDDRRVVFDDVVYHLTFSPGGRLVRVNAEYSAKQSDLSVFVREFSKALNLPDDWQSVADAALLERLRARKAELEKQFTAGAPQVKQIEAQISQISRAAIPTLKCPTFAVTAYFENDRPQVTLRLTNRVDSKGAGFRP